MSELIEKYKNKCDYIKEYNLYTYTNTSSNNAVLAFKNGKNTSFIIENPTSEDVKNFSTLLEVGDLNFLYIKKSKDLLYIKRGDKAYYSLCIFDIKELLHTENKKKKIYSRFIKAFFSRFIYSTTERKDCIVTNKNSVIIIAERYLENSLFDNRKNEIRYLKKENWYHYNESKELIHPLQNRNLNEIGLLQLPTSIIQIYTHDTIKLQPLDFYYHQFYEDYSFAIDSNLDETHIEIEKQLKNNISGTITILKYLENSVLVDLSKSKDNLKKLKTISYSYRFLNENKWYIPLNLEKGNCKEYFITIQVIYNDQLLLFDINGYRKGGLNTILNDFSEIETLSLVIARPMRHKEQRAKCISFHFYDDKIYVSDSDTIFNNIIELTDFIDDWVD